MPLSKPSFKNNATIQTLDFFNVECSFKYIQQNNINQIRTLAEFGKPAIMSIRKPVYRLSSSKTISSSPTRSKIISENESHVSTSKKLIDTQHKSSNNCYKINLKETCPDSVDLTAPKLKNIGNCLSKNNAPPGKFLFKLTEDPRKRFCLKNPNSVNSKPTTRLLELQTIKKFVKTAGNELTNSIEQSTDSSICEVIDLANPLGLDYQGTDYKNTYERDEQTCQNQFEYRKLRRYQHRRKVKVETVITAKKDQQSKMIAYPKHFLLANDSLIQTKKSIKFPNLTEKKNRLIRADQKQNVKQRLEDEKQNRKHRYKQLYLKQREKLTLRNDEEKNTQNIAAQNKAKILADKDTQDLFSLFEHNDITNKREPRKLPDRKSFPHTIAETLKFKHQFKKSKRVLRDRARIKQDFYIELSKNKNIPEAQLEVSSDSASGSPRNEEESTNDEDDVIVGKKGSKFLLRGFRNKFSSNLRGKFLRRGIMKGYGINKGCITRPEWFDSLLPRKVKKINRKDDEWKLFPRKLGIPKNQTQSAIKEFREKPLGQHYDRVTQKTLHFKNPKQLKVKKFNLVGFLYGSADRKYYINSSKRSMHYTDTSIHATIQQNLKVKKSACNSDGSSDSDWIPDDTSVINVQSSHLDLLAHGNMPAPAKRETTIKQHPKHPRDNMLRIPSALLDDFVKTKHIPILTKLKDDKIIVENVKNVRKTPFAKIFDARHHHDHRNAVQHKTLHVRYARKLVYPSNLVVKTKNIRNGASPELNRAKVHPKNYADIALSMATVTNSKQKQKPRAKSSQKEEILNELLFEYKDKVYRSLNNEEFQKFPGRDNFLKFISEINAELNKFERNIDYNLAINKNDYITDLKDDLKSIQSCLSSLSSSCCTNLTKDSGSFIMAGDKKIPLDYLRKSIVPFEELNRNLIEAIPISAKKIESNPFKTVPFSGQKKEQFALSNLNDNFFTFNTKIQSGLRQRLEVKSEDIRKKSLGSIGGNKAKAQVATDVDELYIEDLVKCPNVKKFKWKSCRTMIKDALRKKFEVMLIQGEIVRYKMNNRHNDEYFQQMKIMNHSLEKLFEKWEKKVYESTMDIVHKVKPYYEASDKYKKEYQELNKNYSLLNMEIVYIENDWMRRKTLQNFHYLIANIEWREEHDWIHRNTNRELEGYAESIAKRNIVNIRQRDKDDAWAIKEYYEEIYLKNFHPNLIIFKSSKELIAGIENFKTKTFVMLLELHYILLILAELEQKYHELNDLNIVDLESKKLNADNKCFNKYFMDDRAKQLKQQVQVFLTRPIETTFGDKRLIQLRGICNEVYRDLVPVTNQMDLDSLKQVAFISELLSEVFEKFENIPVDRRTKIEMKHRRLLNYRRNVSKQAVLVESRIASEIIKVKRNLAPVHKKPKLEGRLNGSETKRAVVDASKKPATMSKRASYNYGNIKVLKKARESLCLIQKSIVPFYFDHFLKINGYQPNYNFKTEIELRDGKEIERFQVKFLIPEVLEKFEKWQKTQNRIMEENIRQNPQMYQNVQI